MPLKKKIPVMEILLLLPMSVYILGMTIVPIFQSILLGFQDGTTGKWGLQTYQYLFNRPDFTNSIFNTIFVALVSLAFQLCLGLIIALVLKKKFRGKGIVRAIVLTPMGIPTLVSGIIALYIFGTSGYLNEILFRLGLITVPINWTSGGLRSLLVIIVADTWKVLPTMVLLLLAGLESIPDELYEAGKIDGTTEAKAFRFITLPLLKSTITMSVLFRAVDAFRIFELPQILVGRRIPFIATYAYEEYALNNTNASGAASTVLLVIILVFALLYLKFIDRGEGFSNG
ncbi:carbohydrate ABC transporter permease [Breznakiella homolactica]|uniref:Sugar ABC transporter permease n=1 Tax=Breznakiella homolactica TaxID=2798577 RepID=A0A7T7XKA5_9SPIR|nr:sugar ABC transporter permease [Breznakiella homolactica]QQO07921.1 sugar ABC transporter permease [Breznakiella homolactica]